MSGEQDETLPGEGTLPGVSAADRRPRAAPVRHEAIGRYIVVEEIGAGAMGVVVRAYDPELDRKVAIKLLRESATDWGGSDRGEERRVGGVDSSARILREAQALAKLSHPNVVAVHDVGLHQGQVFVAMEFVEGRDLGAWVRETPRPWREVLDMLRDAGRGLHAAHAAGIVHRDFKPANVMVGNDGRVRVLDFGLARARAELDPEELATVSELGSGERVSEVTRTGAILGTPAYMAPEQYAGTVVDARTDQFSYCVSAWELLYGERPFSGQTLAMLGRQISEGELRPRPRGTRVPLAVHRVLIRGLSPRAEDRFESMEGLLRALEDAAERGRRRARWAVGAVVLAVAGGALVAAAREPGMPQPCEGLDAPVRALWTDERRDAVRAGLIEGAAGLSYAEDTAERVATVLDDYAERWAASRRDACEDTQLRREQSARLLDLRVACLDRSLTRVQATLELFEDADAALVQRAVSATAAAVELRPCEDTERLMAEVEPPPEAIAAEVEAVEHSLSRVRAMQSTGRYDAAMKDAQAMLQRAETLGYGPLLAEVIYVVGSLQMRLGEYKAARETLRRAYFEAVRARRSEVAMEAADDLGLVVGRRLAEMEAGLTWMDHAEAERVRGGLGDAERARLLTTRAGIHIEANAREEAAADYEQALALYAELGMDETAATVSTYNGHGNLLRSLGRYEDALQRHEHGLQVARRVLGPKHPTVAKLLASVSLDHKVLGQYERSREVGEEGLALAIESLGPHHDLVATLHNNLGNLANSQKDYARARDHHEKGLEIALETFGPEHPWVAGSYLNLGNALLDLGEVDQAERRYRQALEVFTAAQGERSLDVALCLRNLGDVAETRGDLASALEYQRRAVEIGAELSGPHHPDTALPRMVFGRLLAETGQRAEAIVQLEQAIADLEAVSRSPSDLVRARFDLARVLGPEQRARARALVEQGLRDAESLGEGAEATRAAMRKWLDEHPG